MKKYVLLIVIIFSGAYYLTIENETKTETNSSVKILSKHLLLKKLIVQRMVIPHTILFLEKVFIITKQIIQFLFPHRHFLI